MCTTWTSFCEAYIVNVKNSTPLPLCLCEEIWSYDGCAFEDRKEKDMYDLELELDGARIEIKEENDKIFIYFIFSNQLHIHEFSHTMKKIASVQIPVVSSRHFELIRDSVFFKDGFEIYQINLAQKTITRKRWCEYITKVITFQNTYFLFENRGSRGLYLCWENVTSSSNETNEAQILGGISTFDFHSCCLPLSRTDLIWCHASTMELLHIENNNKLTRFTIDHNLRTSKIEKLRDCGDVIVVETFSTIDFISKKTWERMFSLEKQPGAFSCTSAFFCAQVSNATKRAHFEYFPMPPHTFRSKLPKLTIDEHLWKLLDGTPVHVSQCKADTCPIHLICAGLTCSYFGCMHGIIQINHLTHKIVRFQAHKKTFVPLHGFCLKDGRILLLGPTLKLFV